MSTEETAASLTLPELLISNSTSQEVSGCDGIPEFGNNESSINQSYQKYISVMRTNNNESGNVDDTPIKKHIYTPFLFTTDNSPYKTLNQPVTKLEFSSENSCNAVYNTISSTSGKDLNNFSNDLSFNGKIDSMLKKVEYNHSSVNISNSSFDNDDSDRLLINENSNQENEEELNKARLNVSLELMAQQDTSSMMYTNEKSPDLFADDDDEDEGVVDDVHTLEDSQLLVIDKSATEEEHIIIKNERILLKRLQMSLTGVLPPPSVTHTQLNIGHMVELYKKHEKEYFYIPSDHTSKCESKESLFKPDQTVEEVKQMSWPNVMMAKAHGIW